MEKTDNHTEDIILGVITLGLRYLPKGVKFLWKKYHNEKEDELVMRKKTLLAVMIGISFFSSASCVILIKLFW